MTGRPWSVANWCTGLGVSVRLRPTGAGGRVSTPTTSWWLSISARRDGSATAGVPLNRTRMGTYLRSTSPESRLPGSPQSHRVHLDPYRPGLLAGAAVRLGVQQGRTDLRREVAGGADQ